MDRTVGTIAVWGVVPNRGYCLLFALYESANNFSCADQVVFATSFIMNTRKLMINVHLVLAALFMPLLLMMPLTGALYILDFKGDQTKTDVFQISESVPAEEKMREVFFKEQFIKHGIDYDFEYIRASKTEFIFRPTTKVHYVASLGTDHIVTVSKVEPTLLKRMIELHKGHGPRAMRWFEAVFGLALILTTLSGLWLAWTVRPYRTLTIGSFMIGVIIIAICMI